MRLIDLDMALARGLADADAGRVKPATAVFDRLEAKYRVLAGVKAGGLSLLSQQEPRRRLTPS
jgi:hypothetical protein